MRGSYSSRGVDVGGNVVAPAGTYTLKIKKVFDTDREGNVKVTKNGDPMVSVLCEIDDTGEYLGGTVWHNVTFLGRNEDGTAKKGAGMAIHFLKTIGQEWEGDFEWDSDDWIGATFRAKLKVTKDKSGQPRNEIAYLLDDEKPEDKPQDEVPF